MLKFWIGTAILTEKLGFQIFKLTAKTILQFFILHVILIFLQTNLSSLGRDLFSLRITSCFNSTIEDNWLKLLFQGMKNYINILDKTHVVTGLSAQILKIYMTILKSTLLMKLIKLFLSHE